MAPASMRRVGYQDRRREAPVGRIYAAMVRGATARSRGPQGFCSLGFFTSTFGTLTSFFSVVTFGTVIVSFTLS